MIEMKSSAAVLNGSPAQVYNRLSNPAGLDQVLRNALEKAQKEGKEIPAELEQNLDKISFTENSITISAGGAGSLSFRLGDCKPDTDVQYVGDGTPVAIILDFNILPEGVDKSMISITVQADIPYMLRPMIQGPMRKSLDALTSMLQQIPSWS